MPDRFTCSCGSNTFRFDRNAKTLNLICEKCEGATFSTNRVAVVDSCACGKDVYLVERNDQNGFNITCTNCTTVALSLGR